MQRLHYFGLLFVTLFLISCGGGGGGGITADNSGGNLGGGTVTPPPADPVYTVTLELLNNSGVADPTTVVSRELPGSLKATVFKDGAVVPFELVLFTTSQVGVIDPVSGTARTNESGVASVVLLPGDIEGAGIAVATITIDGGAPVNDTITIASLGDASTVPDVTGFNIELALKDKNTSQVTTTVSAAAPGKVEVAVTSLDGQPVIGKLVTFTTTLGRLNPEVGTALTDDNGLADIGLFAGMVAGAGEITAQVEVNSAVLGFITLGDEVEQNTPPAYKIVLEVLNSEGVSDPQTEVSQAKPGTLRATLTKNDVALPFELVRFTTEITGVLNPTLGTAQTNAQGVATVTLLPGTAQGTGNARVSFVTPDTAAVEALITFNSAGDAPSSSGSSDVKMVMALKDGTDTNTNITTISATTPGLIEVTVTDFDGFPIVNRVISFSSSLGEFRPTIGTALTDNIGFASIILSAGSVEGAGEVTATFEQTSTKLGFYSLGDVVDPDLITADVSFSIVNCPVDWDRNVRDISLCTETQNISSTEAGILHIKVLKSGSTVPLKSTLVTATSTLGKISPDTGTAITNENGIALLDLLASSDVGAGEVEVTAITTNAKKAFEIGAAEVTISVSNGLAEGVSLAAGATTVISVSIFDIDGSLFIPPLNVEFTSNCAVSTPPKAVLDGNVTSVGGIATATYRADGCSPEDTVTVTVITGGDAITQTVVIPVNEAQIGSMEFVGVSNRYLSLKGTGGQGRSETSTVEFRILDENGNPASQNEVTFELTNDAGGISISPVSAQSNNDGLVQTVVRSGDVSGAVRVLAYSTPTNTDPGNHNNRISVVSDIMIISTGLPDNNSFTLAPQILNPEGLDHDGIEVDISVFMADHFNNPVPDGTAVVLTTEGGAVEPGCTTTGGSCVVKWNSQNVRPFTDVEHYENSVGFKCDGYFGSLAPCTQGILNVDRTDRDRPLGGRFTILAHAVGEESFTDLNGNGVFDAGEYYNRYDLSEAFIDHNENSVYDGVSCADPSDPCNPTKSNGGEFEEYWDFNNDNAFSPPDGVYNGFLCSQAALASGHCLWEPLHVRRNVHMTMSGSNAAMRVVTNPNPSTGTCDDIVFINDTGAAITAAILEVSDLTTQCDLLGLDISIVNDADGNDVGLRAIPMRLYFSDLFNNPMPQGTTVVVTADNGALSGNTSIVVGSTNTTLPLSMDFTVAREGEGNKKTSGAISVTITTPLGTISSLDITLLDDR
ncbi:MAG: hypothetical protein ACI9FJ_000432 [Alteromonadaceae bacterium]|jgi:hypothetical protein